jgi:hypothetical protein
MALIKVNKDTINYSHPLINNKNNDNVFMILDYKYNKNDNIFMILDYKYNTRKNIFEKYIPQIFNNYIVFISAQSFQQNNYFLSKQIRKFVSLYLQDNILCIGGESYLYTLALDKINNITFYTNSQSIYDDCIFNNNIYKKNITPDGRYNLVDYNNYIFNKDIKYDICLINLSKLNKNIINQIQNINKIIIISCHHDDFWKKAKFPNHKLVIRKKFICNKMKYFITVNIFIKKREIISLGSNCSVAYQLKQHNYRFNSYPFDWCNIKINQLINVLKNNFVNYENIKINKLSENHPAFLNNNSNNPVSNNPKPSYILTNDYNIKFAHEVISNNYLDCEEFKNKLIRRINKFKNLIHNRHNPIFIRIELNNFNKDSYYLLLNELDKYFDNYKLILISNNNINHKNIINYKLYNFEDWKYNNLNWKNIFINTYI